MKIGSLVVCVDDSGLTKEDYLRKGIIYTVKSIVPTKNSYGVLLEEIINTTKCYKIERFRELDTPTSISIEEIIMQEV